MKKDNFVVLIVSILFIGALSYFVVENLSSKSSNTNDSSSNEVNEIVIENKTNEKDNQSTVENQPSATIPEVGKEVPDFTLKNLNGEEVSLSDYKGKIVIVNFWATWCKYCVKEMPDLQKFDDENDEIVVLAVNVQEDYDIVKNYIDNSAYSFPVLLDETGNISSTYLVSSFPTSFFINEEGILLGSVPGMMTYIQMNDILVKIKEVN
ncbi:TlpA family protein disulfide reductase [Clostridium grantii]|uniref:Peroxiredoxin n=1 Tax=Clostridium grantii DSM 8605 TaxID=1121316 RepID=A0A1M5UY49_9CLOT|nr:TlpA disulfide reductase family protein [Clostridium grantii]SHH67879.1 Peroxiredoxin [Clostridium grantii DSM 8605]